MIYSINMLSSAHKIKGQGVGSAYKEQVDLVNDGLKDKYKVHINKIKFCDIMHYHTFDFKFFWASYITSLKGVNVGYVHLLPETVDGSLEFPTFVKYVFYKYIIAFYKKMDYLVTVNPNFIEKLGNYGISKDKITYIPNYVSDTEFFEMDEDKKNKLREKYDIKKDDFVVLGVGQIQTRKGINDFIETAKSLKNVKFLWAGGFSFGKISSGYNELKKIVEKPPENVKFLGILDREVMNEIYNISNIMFLPSFQELFPMTILESFNCGVPILLRDIDIYPNVFFDYYLKGNTVEEFRNRILDIKNDSNLNTFYKNKSIEGRNFYSKERVLKLWENFYKMVLVSKRKKINLARG